MELKGPENVVSSDGRDYGERVQRGKVILALYASNDIDSWHILIALCELAVMHEDIVFVTLEVMDKEKPFRWTRALKIYEDVDGTDFPMVVAYENSVMKDKAVFKKPSTEEQIDALEGFISRSFSQ